MAKDFRLKQVGPNFQTRVCEVASATVIEAGDLVAMESNLIVKADEANTAIAYCPNGSADGETSVEVTQGNDFTLLGTGDAAYSEDYRGDIVDVVMSTNDQRIDVGTGSTNVLQIEGAEDSGTVDSASNIEVRINKPIF
ncbi:MAG: hypothetical protein PHS33_08610 [Candidatus Omnitrophica bacterium]|nr:hypothetical protein [Candidatus Omnitrophota bacterium]